MPMSRTGWLALVFCLTAGCGQAERSAIESTGAVVPPRQPSINELEGIWDIALYFDTEQAPSSTAMEIKLDDNGEVTGSFYGSDFSIAQARLHRGEIIFAGVTSDGTGPYAHSGRLDADGNFRGQTLSKGRDFVMAWEATRRDEDQEETN